MVDMLKSGVIPQYVKLFTIQLKCNVLPDFGPAPALACRKAAPVALPVALPVDLREIFGMLTTPGHPDSLLSVMHTATFHHVHLHHGPTGRGKDASVRTTA
jgi:hypothetical protein